MTGNDFVRSGRPWPDLLAGLAAVAAMVLMLVTLPVTLPAALVLGWNGRRRLRAVATVTPCSRCGTLLGPDAPAVSDAAHMAALADMQRHYPNHLVNVARRTEARCRTCGADYAWDARHRALHLLMDPAGDHRDHTTKQAKEEWRCGEC